MRKTLVIIAIIVAIVIIIIVGAMYYAAGNLNTLVQKNRATILARASEAIGRKVEVSQIKVSLGWGVTVDLSGLKVADDPAFSSQDFVAANDVLVKVALLPLLSRHVHISRLTIERPQVRIIRNADGVLNASTIGKKKSASAEVSGVPPAQSGQAGAGNLAATPEHRRPARARRNTLNEIAVGSLAIEDGRISYDDRARGGPPIVLSHVDLGVANFSANSPFNVTLALAALGSGTQNIKVKGRVGPVARAGKIDANATPLKLAVTLGPLDLASLARLPMLAGKIPPKLAVSGPVTANVNLDGTLEALKFDFATDLGANHVAYQGVLDKPDGVVLKLAAKGSRTGGNLAIAQANLALAGLALKASNVRIGHGTTTARIDTNRFDLAGVARTLSALQKYTAAGQAEVHADLAMASGAMPQVNGTVGLYGVSLAPVGAKTAMVSGVTGQIRMNGNSAVVGPLQFKLGSSPATLSADAKSLKPLDASYSLGAGALKLAEVIPRRKPADNEHIDQLKVSGAISRSPDGIAATADATSPAGLVQGVSYSNLALAAQWAHKRLTVRSLKLNAFGGAIDATAAATMAAAPIFNVSANLSNIDLQQALASQKAKAADMIRGLLTGTVQASGAGKKFDQIKPTLKGGGQLHIVKGELIGVNIAAQALNKVQNIPGIGALMPVSVIDRHPELFKNPNTDIDDASLTFTLLGPRITSHDILVKSTDYSLAADGWFDMDKNVDLTAQLLLTPALTREIIAAKKNVAYVTNRSGQLEVPLRVTGVLPKPMVTPDVSVLARNAASHAIESKGEKLFGKFLGKKGLGGVFGGSGGGAQPAATPNPLNQLRKFF